MQSKHLRFIAIFLTLGLISGWTLGMAGCSSKKTSVPVTTLASNATMLTTTTTALQTTLTTTYSTTATTSPLSSGSTTSIPTYTIATTLTAFPYQGSGNGNWSGQVTLNNTTYQISGTMTISIDANGNLTGSITSNKTGGTVPTTITAQIDPNGNLSGTVSFTVDSFNFVTNWQGKISVAGNSMSLQGTWTGSYGGSGVFSGSGTTSN